MTLQNILFGNGEMYIRSKKGKMPSAGLWAGRIKVPGGAYISTDTYMNAFDLGAWKRYTKPGKVCALVRMKGCGSVNLLCEKKDCMAVCLGQKRFVGSETEGWSEYCFELSDTLQEGILYLAVRAEEDIEFEAGYKTFAMPEREVKISLVICTYRRPKQLAEILTELEQGDKEGEIRGTESERMGYREWLRVRIVDNASEMQEGIFGRGIDVYHNPNTGGAGGFSRGMEETVRHLAQFEATHVLLMDDDVVFHMESLYRLRALLSYLKEEYEQGVVSGRMFRLDDPNVQYTAAEIWNGGKIRHLGWNQDMRSRKCLWNMNDNKGGEYSGWWFACFPIQFVEQNRPLPFFLHCDDVEYGLRHGGTPVILNGIQVWHETSEYRQSPLIMYYDFRNTLFVNFLYGCSILGKNAEWTWFKEKITEEHNKGDYLSEYFLIRAYRDYLRGYRWFLRKNDERLHSVLLKKKKANRYFNSVRWRYVWLVAVVKRRDM